MNLKTGHWNKSEVAIDKHFIVSHFLSVEVQGGAFAISLDKQQLCVWPAQHTACCSYA
jgi:hypothetical protein